MKASTPRKQTVRQQQAYARRQQIMEVAIRLFARHGVAGTSTRQIAQEVGITEGLIFHYFPTKLDLVRAVAGSSHVFLGDLREILKDANVRPVAEVMGQVVTVWLDLLRRESDVSAILFGEAQINPEIGGIVHEVIEEGAESIQQFLDARKRAGEITTVVDTKIAAHMYMASILTFFLRYRRLDEQNWKKESDSFANNLLAAWLRMVSL